MSSGEAGIPFNRPTIAGKELEYVEAVLRGGPWSGDGPFTRRCSELLEHLLGSPKVLLTTSCTHALELAGLLLELGPGDEVILPSFTFASTVNAIVLRGARPVFVDIREDTLNIDENSIERAMTPRTRAIFVVHYAGVGCAMDRITALAESARIALVEDNAHGLFGTFRGRPLGTFGGLATLSFHETKNIACGEGGALIINHPAFIERAEIIREKGTDRSRFFRGLVDKYTWVDVGSSYLPSEILAAVLYGQLEAWETIQRRRLEIWSRYTSGLRDWAARYGIGLPTVPPDCQQPGHLFYLILPSMASRTSLIAHLRARGILAVFHYLPLHLSPAGRRYGYHEGSLPVTEAISDRLLRLPLYAGLSKEEQDHVVQSTLEWEP
jgi:dTDP-4-amino-4,6-dideoxygalactose transaminase